MSNRDNVPINDDHSQAKPEEQSPPAPVEASSSEPVWQKLPPPVRTSGWGGAFPTFFIEPIADGEDASSEIGLAARDAKDGEPEGKPESGHGESE